MEEVASAEQRSEEVNPLPLTPLPPGKGKSLFHRNLYPVLLSHLLRYLIPRINMPSHAYAWVVGQNTLDAEVLHLTGGGVCVE